MAKRARIQKPKLTANQTAYEKERRRLMRGVRRWEREGFIFSEDFTLDRPKRVTKKLLQKMRELKPADLLAQATAVGEGGEIVSGEVAYQERRRESIRKGQATRRLQKIRRQLLPPDQIGMPGGDIPTEGEIAYYNVYLDFISRLSETPENTSVNGNYRRQSIVSQSNRERTTLLTLTQREVSRVGEEDVGNRLIAHGDAVWELTKYVLYGSTEATIMSASRELAEIIAGDQLSLKELRDLGEVAEELEDWDEPS